MTLPTSPAGSLRSVYGKCAWCGVEYDHEPALDVTCPRCGAKPGVKCFDLAPSGHRKTGGFANGITGPWGHPERDLQAVIDGAYKCDCGCSVEEARARIQGMQENRARQMDLFAEPSMKGANNVGGP
jgi:DNA-directed RNA polymerase subunit RPC12/RpoP